MILGTACSKPGMPHLGCALPSRLVLAVGRAAELCKIKFTPCWRHTTPFHTAWISHTRGSGNPGHSVHLRVAVVVRLRACCSMQKISKNSFAEHFATREHALVILGASQ